MNKTEYLQPQIEINNLHDKDKLRVTLPLASGVSAITDATKPEARTTGNTVVYATGKLKINTPAANMELVTFPNGYLPHNVGQFIVSVQTGATSAAEAVEMSSTGIKAIGTPVANNIYHLDSIIYLSRGD